MYTTEHFETIITLSAYHRAVAAALRMQAKILREESAAVREASLYNRIRSQEQRLKNR
jgi:hypothetical protein